MYRIIPEHLRQGSIDDINLDQFLKITNYEDTVKQLDIYYGIGERVDFGLVFKWVYTIT